MTIQYENVSHIIDKQYAAEQAFLQEFAAGNYTLQNPLVKLNPYSYCPLTAVLLFRTPVATEITVTVLGKEEAGNISHTFPAEKEHILPIYGLYAGYDNKVVVVAATGQKQVVTIQTEPAIADAHQATSIKTTAEYMGNNIMFLTTAMDSMPVGYDYKGDIRWYANVNFNFDLKRMPNGHLLIGTERLVEMPYYTTGLYEMIFSGKIYKEYRGPIGGYHHDQFYMEDGNILMLTYDAGSGTVEDTLVLLDKETGAILRKWDYKDVLPQYPTAGSGSQDEIDWFHNNAVWYDKRTNSLTLSGRHQDAVINIDYELDENGKCKLNWILGDPEGWPEDMQKYFFKPVGDVANFDWQYGKERGAEFFSPYICNVEYYEEGHYMVHSGGIGYEDGVTCEGLAVEKCMVPNHGHQYTFNSITCELLNNQLVYELQVPANCYRAEKLPLYYANETLQLGKGELLGSLKATPTTKMKIKAVESEELVPDTYKIQIKEEIDRVAVQGIFEEDTLVQILLLAEDGATLRYPVETGKKEFQAMCVGTFQKADTREVDTFINKTGLTGRYTVKILVTEEEQSVVYQTGVAITA